MKDSPKPAKRRRYDAAFRAKALRLASGSRSTLAAGELERRLAEQLGASTRTVRERLNELFDTAAEVLDDSGRAYHLTKDRYGKETRFALVSAAGTDLQNVGTLAKGL